MPIEIKEIIPIKLPGRTSLLVHCPTYNEQVVTILRSYQPAVWHKKILCWEIPITYLAKMLDSLTFFDDIKLTLFNDSESSEISPKLTDEEIEQFKYRPFDHQLEGINFLLEKKKSLLLDSMGVGKSIQMMYLAEVLHRRGLIEHCLIICGIDALRSNWKSEIQKFSKESCMVLGERINKAGKTVYDTIPKRVEQLKNKIEEFFVIVNIASIRSDQIVDAILTGPNKFGLIVVDEVHKCLTGDTIVQTSVGKQSLSELANMREEDLPKILSYNIKTNQDEFKQISNIHISRPVENLLELEIYDNNTKYSIKCTESHKLYTTNRGWVKAKDLTPEDNIKVIS